MRVLYFFLTFPPVFLIGLSVFGGVRGPAPIDYGVVHYVLMSTLILLMLYWLVRLFASLSEASPKTKSYISIIITLVLWLGFPLFVKAILSQSDISSNMNFYYQGALTIEDGVQTEHGLRVARRHRIVVIVSVGIALALAAVITKLARKRLSSDT